MLAYLSLAWQSRTTRWFRMLAFMVVLSAVSSLMSALAMVAEEAETGSAGNFTLSILQTIGHDADGDAGLARRERVLDEAIKQAIDQPLHFLMAAGPIWLSRYALRAPWYGWSVVPVLVYREWTQWPSSRWWDPPLDAAVFILGVLASTWMHRSKVLGAGHAESSRARRLAAHLDGARSSEAGAARWALRCPRASAGFLRPNAPPVRAHSPMMRAR